MTFPRNGYERALVLTVLMCIAPAYGGFSGPTVAQEMPRGVATDLFDVALRDTLDTPPQGRSLPRGPIRFGSVALIVGTFGVLAVIARRWRKSRKVPVKVPDVNPPSPTRGSQTPAPVPQPVEHTHSRPPPIPINLPPNVVDLLRRNAQRRLETGGAPEMAEPEGPVPSGYDEAPRSLVRPRVDFWISDAGGNDE